MNKQIKLTVRVPEKLYRQFKVQLAKNGHTVQSVIESGINGYLLRKEAPKGKI